MNSDQPQVPAYKRRFIGAIPHQVRRGTALPWLEEARGIARKAQGGGRLGELLDAMTPRQQRVLSEFLLGAALRCEPPIGMEYPAFAASFAEVKLKLARWEAGGELVQKGKPKGSRSPRSGKVVRELQALLSCKEDRERLLPLLSERERSVVERRLAHPKERLEDAGPALGISPIYVAKLQKSALERIA